MYHHNRQQSIVNQGDYGNIVIESENTKDETTAVDDDDDRTQLIAFKCDRLVTHTHSFYVCVGGWT